jgi:hypothetical protein
MLFFVAMPPQWNMRPDIYQDASRSSAGKEEENTNVVDLGVIMAYVKDGIRNLKDTGIPAAIPQG